MQKVIRKNEIKRAREASLVLTHKLKVSYVLIDSYPLCIYVYVF